MVNQNMAADQELVHDDSAFEAEFAKHGLDTELHDDLRADVFGGEDLGGFESLDDLNDFLAKFDTGTDEEAMVQTQGDADIGGEPLTTVH